MIEELVTHPNTACREISNIRGTKTLELNDSRLVVQLSLPNPLKPGVKSRMKMWLVQRRQGTCSNYSWMINNFIVRLILEVWQWTSPIIVQILVWHLTSTEKMKIYYWMQHKDYIWNFDDKDQS